jgi:signal transduction histidine kinase
VPADHEAYYSLVDGEPYLSSFDAPAALLDDEALVERWATVDAPERWTAETAIGEVRMLAVPMHAGGEVAGVFVVTYLPGPDRSDVLQAVRVIAVAGLVVTITSAVLAWSLAGRVLRPVRQLTSTARSITDADLSGRIPVEGDDELAELGRTFNEMVDRLEDGFRDQRQFLDDVAHELRTPITIAQGHLELLGDDPDEVAETVAIVRDELERMSRYVSELLVLAKAEQPDFLRLQLVDLTDLVQGVLPRAAALGDRRWVLDDSPPPGTVLALADAARLEQAVLNLAGNAVRHTRPGAEIGLGVVVRERTAALVVRDTGEGVDPRVAGHLFQRYTQGAHRFDGQGTGIGLSIVDAIARAHDGHVEVDSEPGRGATFRVVVPLAEGLPAPTAAPPTDHVGSSR